MVEFFRDKLDGALYIVVALIALFFIMAIIGFIMERLKLEKEEKEKFARVGRSVVTPVIPIEPVAVEPKTEQIVDTNPIPPTPQEDDLIIENYFKEPNEKELEQQANMDNNQSYQQSQNVIVFDDPDENKE